MLKHVTDEQRSQPGCTRRRIGRVLRLEAPKVNGTFAGLWLLAAGQYRVAGRWQ